MSTSDAFDEDEWREELLGYRGQKDEFFAVDRQSPIPADDRSGFDGLSYFDPDFDFRVKADLELVGGGDTITLETTVDTEMEYERVARLHFVVDGEECALVAYRQADDQTDERSEEEADGGDGSVTLFVPFRDKTTGQQTYGAGRYLEFHVEGDVEAVETVTLDFNLAYHPFCAYNEAFACPLPPRENWLEVPVEAGEKLPDARPGSTGPE